MMKKQQLTKTKELIKFINESPSAFHAVESAEKMLLSAGFKSLSEADAWDLTPGKGYYLTRNRSSILAFRVPQKTPRNCLIAASHTDSPMLKLKPNCEVSSAPYLRLNTEVYGGMILSSWMDRPLSLAGRVILDENGVFSAKTVKIDRDLMLIPNVAIHQNRNVNTGYAWNPAKDMLPLLAEKGNSEASLKALLSKELGCNAEQITGMDLYVFCRMAGSIWGASNEFFSAPRIDNLMCMYGTLQGFLEAEQQAETLTVYFAADNEETGSATKQGAGSVMLSDTLSRICECLSCDKRRLLAGSMMVSADNAHAKHPNHPELSDADNAPVINGGVVIKTNAAQKYATDGVSAALFSKICQTADVPTQVFANRSDMAGGSTLGSISNTLVPLLTVDIGMAQLAMHSAYETAGVADTDNLIRAMKAFYNCRLTVQQDGVYHLDF